MLSLRLVSTVILGLSIVVALTTAALVADNQAEKSPFTPVERITALPVIPMTIKDTLTVMVTNESGKPWVYLDGPDGPRSLWFLLFNEEGMKMTYQIHPMEAPWEPNPRTLAPGESVTCRFDLSRYYMNLPPGRYRVLVDYAMPRNHGFVTEHGVTPISFQRPVAWIAIPEPGPGEPPPKPWVQPNPLGKQRVLSPRLAPRPKPN